MNIDFVPYDKRFFDLSWKWLNDAEIKKLTMTPDMRQDKRQEWFDSLSCRKDYLIWGIMVDGHPIGCVGIKHIDFEKREGEYWGYIGQKEYWGKGIGKEMLSFSHNNAVEMGLEVLVLNVLCTNHRAIRLYEKNGYLLDNEHSTREIAQYRKALNSNNRRMGNS